MCGRYYIDSDRRDDMIREVLESVETKYENTPALKKMKTGEIFPTDTAPVITQREPVLMEWGFTRFDGKGRVINARLETAGEKPMFRGCYAGQRCLIPASYYFEWEKTPQGKQKYAIGLDTPVYMAGLYRIETAGTLPLFVILTRPAAEGIAFIHDRMPVILAEDAAGRWLSAGRSPAEVLADSAGEMNYRAV